MTSNPIAYTDDDVLFYLVVYRDVARCRWCLMNLRKHYPTARVVIDTDGDPDPQWTALASQFNVELHYGERLFTLDHGGEIVKRALQHHFDDPKARRWLLRIDTDTEIRRRLEYLPDADYFGTYRNWRNFVQGGCIGISRNATCRIFELGLLDRETLLTPLTWQGGDPHIANERVAEGLVSFDWIVNWAMNEATILAADWPEIVCNWKDPVPQSADCAIAHPDKHIAVDRQI